MKKLIQLCIVATIFCAFPAFASNMNTMSFETKKLVLEKVENTLFYNAAARTEKGVEVRMSAFSPEGPTGWSHWGSHNGILSFQPHVINSYGLIEFSEPVDLGTFKVGLGRGGALGFVFADGSNNFANPVKIGPHAPRAGEVSYAETSFGYSELDLSRYKNVVAIKVFKMGGYSGSPEMFRPIEMTYLVSELPVEQEKPFPTAMLVVGGGIAGLGAFKRKPKKQ